MAITKGKLSGSTSGKNIKVAATGTPGTTIHTAVASTTSTTWDEVWLWACNSDTTDRKLTIEYGGTTSPDDTVEMTIPAEAGWVLIVPGMVLQNSLVVKAFCASANVMLINGYINAVS